jgi:hypothetical protein
MSRGDQGQQDSVVPPVEAGRDAYAAGRDIAVTNYATTSYISAIATDKDAAFRVRIDRAVEELAEAVGDQWRAEERLRRIHDPIPLPVRWTAADPLLSDHPANIYRLPAHAPDLDGSLDRVAGTFLAIPSRRLVVIGPPGAGKTVFTLRLTLDLLRLRRPGGEVPVIFGLHKWDPREQPLQDWMAAQLAADYPALRGTGRSRRTIASELIRRRLILPVLDGLDEVSESLRGDALRGLNLALNSDAPVIMTCREADYRQIVDDVDVLTSAAVVNLLPLGLADLADYLPRTTRKLAQQAPAGFATKWDPVIERLRSDPANPACQVLLEVFSTPLMTSLARSVYSDTAADPATLLQGDFGDRQSMEAHLLDAFIPAAFTSLPTAGVGRRRRRSMPDDAEGWLTFLARHLDRLGTRDLQWWRIQDALPAPARWLVTGLVAGTSLGVILPAFGPSLAESWLFAAAFGLAPSSVLRYPTGTEGAALAFTYSVLGGLALGAVIGTAGIEAGQAPMTTPLRLRRKFRAVSGRLAFGIGRGLLNALVLGLALMATWLLGYTGTMAIRVETATLGFPAGGSVHGIPDGGAYADYPNGLRYTITADGARYISTIKKVPYYIDRDGGVSFSLKECKDSGAGCQPGRPEIVLYEVNASGDTSATPEWARDFFDDEQYSNVNFYPWLYEQRLPLGTALVGGNNLRIAASVEVIFLVVGVVCGLFVWLGFPADVTRAISPPSTVASDRDAAFFRVLVIALLALLPLAIVQLFVQGSVLRQAAFLSVALGALALSLSPWTRLQVARAYLASVGRVPWRLMSFLDEAHSRGVLRQAGAVYQFRHASLQERLVSRPRRRSGRPE